MYNKPNLPGELVTRAHDAIERNKSANEKLKTRIPPFFPKGLYEMTRMNGGPPVGFTMNDMLAMLSPGTMELFARLVVKGKSVEDAATTAPSSLFFRGNPFYPKNRIRPLVTYPAEELDRLPRFRPFYNTTLVFADVSNLESLYPESLRFLMDIIRHEPVCEAFYFVSDYHNNNARFLTEICDTLRQPAKSVRVDYKVSDVTDLRAAILRPCGSSY